MRKIIKKIIKIDYSVRYILIIVSIISAVLLLLEYWDVWYILPQQTLTYTICSEDKDIRYYDREVDLVFEDSGLKWCEEIILKQNDNNWKAYWSWKAEEINWEKSEYWERDFDRNNYNPDKYSIVK